MSKSAILSDQLARAYREARVLVLGDRTPKVDRAFALHREFLALRASLAGAEADSLSEWEVTFLERTRRAIIVALRHQAIAVRDRWSESRSALGLDHASPHFDLEHALQLATAAMQLHTDRDPDAARTAKVMEFIRQSRAQAGVVPADAAATFPSIDIGRDSGRASERPPAQTAPETRVTVGQPSIAAATAMPSNVDPADAPIAALATDAAAYAPTSYPPAAEPTANPAPAEVSSGSLHAGPLPPDSETEPPAREAVEPQPQVGRAPHASRLWPALTAAGFVILVGAASLLLRVKTTPATDAAPNPGRPNVATEVPAPARTADPVRVTIVRFQSEPSGARVTVDGQFRGTTPLSIEGKPGDVLTIVVQKDNRTWRGVLTIGSEGKQTVTVRLPAPRVAQTPRAQPSKAAAGGHKRFDAAMREGIDLYNKGWFGPAVGRFREAVSLDPKSSDAHLWLARALIRSDRGAEAKPVLERVIELAKTGPQAEEAAVLLSKL
jgi:hypothetical protein